MSGGDGARPSARELSRQLAIMNAFSPAAPITDQDLFAKRGDKMDELLEIVMQRGQHGVIYGERGVGKTSFVTVMARLYEDVLITGRVNCASGETFDTIVRHAFDSISVSVKKTPIGFAAAAEQHYLRASSMLDRPALGPEDVRMALQVLSATLPVVLFIDEFDRVSDVVTRRRFADTIKALSDHSVPATIILVGVADTVGEMIAEHESISRALAQLHMPRMDRTELEEVLDKGFAAAKMTIADAAREQVVQLSRGLPHYTHLLGLHAGLSAVSGRRPQVGVEDVGAAVGRAVQKAHQEISAAYGKAVWNSEKTARESVLLACALAEVDEHGYFGPADVKVPMSQLAGEKRDPRGLVNDLNQFASETRGAILQRTGVARAFRYRFRDPLLQPYIVLRGVSSGLVDLAH